jgi:hypothetical protein
MSDFRQPPGARELISLPGLVTRKHTGFNSRPHAPLIRTSVSQFFGQIEIEVWNVFRGSVNTKRYGITLGFPVSSG